MPRAALSLRLYAALCFGADLLPLAGRVRWPQGRPSPAIQAIGNGEQPAQAGDGRTDPGQPDSQGSRGVILLGPARRRICVDHVRSVLGVSERRACKVLEQPRSTQRHEPPVKDDEQALTNDIVGTGHQVRPVRLPANHRPAATRRVGCELQAGERIWRREG